MTVYLDILGHLCPDPETMDLDELHAFAKRAGLKRAWFQGDSPVRYPHYDVMGTRMRDAAVKAGAVQITARSWMQRRLLAQGARK